jgi:DNA-binding MarR family transcriptional regulator
VLTDAGKAEREVIFKQQSEVRRRAMQGITDQEYTTVLGVLQRIVNNLE